MSTILRYKGYEGSAELDMERGICHGRILFISDLITYEASAPAALEAEFRDAVDDYLETCSALERKPQRPLTGQFNVRVLPDLHKDAKRRAIEDDTSLNDVVGRALSCYLQKSTEVTNNHYLVVGDTEAGNRMLISATAEGSQTGVTTSVRTH